MSQKQHEQEADIKTPRNSAAEVFGTYRERLLKFIRSRVRLLEDAEDILQDVFSQFSEMESLAKPVEQTAAWLYRVARNKIIDKSRKKKDAPLPVTYDEDGEEYIFDDIADILYGTEATPETDYLRSLIIEEIELALAELPDDQRLVFELTEIEGYSVKEVAEKTGVPVNTVLSRKHYAVKRLRKCLSELYDDAVDR